VTKGRRKELPGGGRYSQQERLWRQGRGRPDCHLSECKKGTEGGGEDWALKQIPWGNSKAENKWSEKGGVDGTVSHGEVKKRVNIS